MKAKRIFITGATDGIGKQTALELAKTGAEVILHGRNTARGRESIEEIIEQSGNRKITYENADLASLAQVNKLAARLKEKYDSLDVLINNAGVFKRGQTFTKDEVETTFGVNHLAHFSLTVQLLPLMLQSKQGRVVTVSSIAHSNSPKIPFDDLSEINSYIDYSAYSLSKMANILFSIELAERLKDTTVTSNSLHPGVITTKLLHEGFGISGSSVEEGCKTSVFLAIDESLSDVSGNYFINSKASDPSPLAFDPAIRRNLWELSEKLSGKRFADYV